ncbi:hypothetical protein TRVA0_006S01772 [Trichomonascus vanleenenianus]|uniref:uncharacterized protein n=1 Tax=Trichomonascus vanleenenianus TaxID=2268995 RepID=UPI003EC97F8B
MPGASARNDDKVKPFLTSECSASALADRLAQLNIKPRKGISHQTQSINQRDIFGRTLLHIAASIGRPDLVAALLENVHLDLAQADYESGYNALHRALASGNIAAAQLLYQRSRDLNAAKDRSKQIPTELLKSSIPQYLDSIHLDPGDPVYASQLFTFGSNANNTLGFADPDDRSNPEMVKLRRDPALTPLSHKFKPITIRQVEMSKLHTVILTDDQVGNLLVCGVPRGGRLGLGRSQSGSASTISQSSTSSTQFTFTKIDAFLNERIVDVSLGKDHSIAVSANGDCYTWGSNKHGQLGYAVDSGDATSLDDDAASLNQYYPRKVGSELKKFYHTSCSASAIHSVVYSENDILCWGTNVGQMGFSSEVPGSTCQIYPRQVLHLPAKITKVQATDIATVVLFQNHDIWVYMNYDHFRVPFPQENERSRDSFDVFRPPSANSPGHIVDISASRNGNVCALTNRGVVFQFSLEKFYTAPDQHEHSPPMRPAQISKSLKISTVWRGASNLNLNDSTKEMRAISVDVGDDKSIILCTAAGSVYRRSKSSSFERVPYINRIVSVRCDPGFKSFAALRQEVQIGSVFVDAPNVADDFHYLVPYMDYSDTRKSAVLLRADDPERAEWSPYGAINNYNRGAESDDEDEEEDPVFEIDGTLMRFLSSLSQNSVAIRLSHENLRRYDIKFKIQGHDIGLPLHSAIAKARSAQLAELITLKKSSLDITGSPGQPDRRLYFDRATACVIFENFELEALAIFLYFLYTDRIVHVWTSFRHRPPENILKTREELLLLGKHLDLPELRLGIMRQRDPSPTLSRDMVKMLIEDDAYDIALVSQQGDFVYAHSFVLISRSSYFATLLSDRWSIGTIEHTEGKRVIRLESTTKETISVVLRHIYGDKRSIHELFDLTTISTTKQLIQQVLDVLALADEWLLLKLKQKCEAILTSFVTIRNAGMLLSEAVIYHAAQLEERLLRYICLNMDSILENGFLADADCDLLERVDSTMKSFLGTSTGTTSIQTFFDYINDINEHNDICSNFVPIFGSSSINSLLRSGRRRPSRYKEERPQLVPTKSTPSKQVGSSPSPPVVPSTPTVQPPSPVSPILQPISNAATPTPTKPLTQEATIPNTPKSNRASMATIGESSPVSASERQFPSTPTKPVSIGDVYNNLSPSSADRRRSSASSPAIKFSAPPKVSQKERKRIQKEQHQHQKPETPVEATSSSVPPASPWEIKPAAAVGKASSESPFAVYQSGEKRKAKQPSEVYKPTLADIIRQEQRDNENRQRRSTRSLKEIQQEEEFERWWREESLKYQRQQDPETVSRSVNGDKPSSSSRGRGRGRGGGRGRGRGGKGDARGGHRQSCRGSSTV